MVQTAKKISFARQHLDALLLAGEIRETIRRMYFPRTAMIRPEQVIAILNKAKVRFVLMGTYAINGYRDEARATQDVDVLVRTKDHAKAVKAIRGNFPNFPVEDFPVVTRFRDPTTDKPVIDLMKPLNDALSAVFKNSVAVRKSHRVPTLEMALVSKFAAMVSPFRERTKKLQDVADFAAVVLYNRHKIDHKKLERLADLVYEGGRVEAIKLLEDIVEGRPIQV